MVLWSFQMCRRDIDSCANLWAHAHREESISPRRCRQACEFRVQGEFSVKCLWFRACSWMSELENHGLGSRFRLVVEDVVLRFWVFKVHLACRLGGTGGS